jgi:hypothetical protein
VGLKRKSYSNSASVSGETRERADANDCAFEGMVSRREGITSRGEHDSVENGVSQ